MSDFPEHGRQAKVAGQTQAIGEFLDWLAGQGVHLMKWREDLTDTRPADPECPERRQGASDPIPCDPDRADDGKPASVFSMFPLAYWKLHCGHWLDPEREREHAGVEKGICCRCGKGRHYEVTGLKAWVAEPRGTLQLLADWARIDLAKIEAEKRRMLAVIRSANGEASREAQGRGDADGDCGCGLGSDRCRAAEDGDIGD